MKEATPNTTSGTWAPYTESSTMKGAICNETKLSNFHLSHGTHHGPNSRPEGAGAEASRPHHGGEDLGGVDIADCQGVDGRDPPGQIEDHDGPLVREIVKRNEVRECQTDSP